MNAVPKDIAKIIEAEQERRQEIESERMVAEAQARAEAIKKGTEIMDGWIKENSPLVPQWLLPYVDRRAPEDSLYQIGSGRWKPDQMRFEVPGLAPILFKPGKQEWLSASLTNHYYAGDMPNLVFRDRWWAKDVMSEVLAAREAQVEYEKAQAAHEEWVASQAASDQERNARSAELDAQLEAERQQQVQQEKDQAAELLAALKDDPLAIVLLEAFVTARKERSQLEAQVLFAAEGSF